MTYVLAVEDDTNFTPALGEFIKREGFDFGAVENIKAARQQLEVISPDLLLLDLQLPDGNALELMPEVNIHATRVVVMTAYPDVENVITSLRAQVSDYLVKPIDMRRLREMLRNLRTPTETPNPLQYLVGESPAMQRLREVIHKVAPTNASVLLQGNSGTGKELVAKAIHDLSGRRDGPFLSLNCGAISNNLIGSELFGHEKGSFTGANRRHLGYFERAAGGTLFLDEITEMPLDLQVQMLRVLETNRITRVGGDREIEVDVRILAATNRIPERAIAEGKLREDLFFRLAVFPVRLPPLRERSDDVLLLAEHFLKILNNDKKTSKRLSWSAAEVLTQRAWPGNIRELKNTMQRAFILADDTILPEHFPPVRVEQDISEGKLRFSVGTPIEEAERQLILTTLNHFHGNKPLTAQTLGVSLKTLYNRLKQYRADGVE
mgnify:CR=1 FL=1